MRLSHELQIGKAGEYLVCTDLIMKGFVAYPSEQGLPYDLVLDTGQKLLRVQVKTCERARRLSQRITDIPVYQFTITLHGKNRKKIYGEDEVDVFALVALDTRSVGYIKGSQIKATMNFRSDELKGSYYDEKGIQDYKKVLELHKSIKSQTEIAKQLNLNVSIVNRMLKKGYKPYKTSARYFSDIYKEKEWFYDL